MGSAKKSSRPVCWWTLGVILAGQLFGCVVQASDMEAARKAYAKKDYEATLLIVRPLAAQGDSQAQQSLGMMLLLGQGVKQSASGAVPLLTSAADAGLPLAQALLASFVYMSDLGITVTPESAARWAYKSAEQGNELGMYILGLAYLNGVGLPRNDEQGAEWVQKAARLKFPLAQYELGLLTLTGRGVKSDFEKAEFWLRSVENSNEDIKSNVDVILRRKSEIFDWQKGIARLTCGSLACAARIGHHGRRLKKAFDEMRWVELAARTLDVGFAEDLEYFYLGRAAEGIGNIAVALDYYNTALNPKQSVRKCAAFINNCFGVDVPKAAKERIDAVSSMQRKFDQVEMERLAQQAAERREEETAEAQRMAKEKETVRMKAAEELRTATLQAAQQGSGDAQHRLALMYFTGDIVTRDMKAGLSWLTKAAKNGVADAQFELGERYRTGASLPKDEVAAELWLKRAADKNQPDATASLAMLRGTRLERAAATAAAERKRKEARSEQERRRDAERIENEQKKKRDNAAKLRSL
jgi:TPR repeat protein